MADIFDGYRLAEAWDEMFAAPGEPRASYAGLISALQPMDPAELRFRADQLARLHLALPDDPRLGRGDGGVAQVELGHHQRRLG